MLLDTQAAIVGIGATEFSKNSGRSELRLAAEAVIGALTDAGLTPADVDGFSTLMEDNNGEAHRANSVLITNYYGADITPTEEVRLTANQLYAQAHLTPKDIQVAIIYDHFAPTVFNQLEGYGFCARGEAKDFVKNGNIEIGGHLPINTHGGQLGEAYIHGMNGLAEGVRQIRGTAVNQVINVENVLVAGGNGAPTSGLILAHA